MRLIDADALADELMERYCNDCDRRKGIKNGKYRIIYNIGEAPCRACAVGDMTDELEDAPTVDAEPVRHGRWQEETYMDGTYWECSVCGYEWDLIEGTPTENRMNYCPQCGVKMDGGDDAGRGD